MMKVLKIVVLAFFILLNLPFIIISKIEEKTSKKEGFFSGIGQLLSLVPGKIGNWVRLGYYYPTLEDCGWNAYIGFGALIPHRKSRIGKRVVVGAYCIIGTVTIEDDVLIASRVSIPSGKHQHVVQEKDALVTSAELQFNRLRIGRNTWIGEGALILADIGENCTVAAGSVVTKNVADNCNVFGNPARVIGWKQ